MAEGDVTRLLACRDLCVTWRPRSAGGAGAAENSDVVRGVALEVAPGEILGICGESGCGKSTLLRALGLLIPARTGSIEYDGQTVFDHGRRPTTVSAKVRRAMRRRLQIVFQDPISSLDPRLTVEDSIAEGPRNFAVWRSDVMRDRVVATLRSVGLPGHFVDRLPAELSGGERRRVALARAFILEPSVVLLDEPTSSLDVLARDGILNLILADRRERGTAFILVTHDMAVLRRVTDRVAVMRDGLILESGDVADLFERPVHPYTRDLLDAALARRRETPPNP